MSYHLTKITTDFPTGVGLPYYQKSANTFYPLTLPPNLVINSDTNSLSLTGVQVFSGGRFQTLNPASNQAIRIYKSTGEYLDISYSEDIWTISSVVAGSAPIRFVCNGTTQLQMTEDSISFPSIPSADPAVAGSVYSLSGYLRISDG